MRSDGRLQQLVDSSEKRFRSVLALGEERIGNQPLGSSPVIFESPDGLEYGYFLSFGLTSLVIVTNDGRTVEVGIVRMGTDSESKPRCWKLCLAQRPISAFV